MKNNNVVPFVFSDNPVRIVMQDEQPWFVAKDIAKILDYRDASNLVRILDDDEGCTHIMSIPSQNQYGNFGENEKEILLINESGLYHAIFVSRKPEAKLFRKWVTSEILPSIRKTGQYKINDIKHNIHSLVILQRQSSILMKEINREKNQNIINYLYAQLEQIANELKVTPPPLDSFITVRSDIVQVFWNTYTRLKNRGIDCDHSNKSNLIAINLNEFYALAKDNDLSPPNKMDLIPALKKDPQFIKVAAVASRQTRHTIKCWIFNTID